jgi:hypothetical protein
MVSQADARQFRGAQAAIRELVYDDLDAFWSTLDLSKPLSARNALTQYVSTVVQQYGAMSAGMAADWFDVQRGLAGVDGDFTANPAVSPYLDGIQPTVRRASGALFTDNPLATLRALKAVTGKYVLAAGRETIAKASVADPQARGWKRITRVGACAFCLMLAGRGGVYTRDSAFFASHGDCNCAAVPEWDADAPEVDVRLYQISRRTSRMSPEQKDAHNARIRAYLASQQ